MSTVLFWDIDTQYDFMFADGKLYVPNAEEIIPNLAKLTKFARKENILNWGSVDYHNPGDPEISDHPDFFNTFPLHCEKDTAGQEKIEATKPINPLWIDSEPIDHQKLEMQIKKHTGEVFFRKQRFDVFTNPNVIPALEIIKPADIYVYGVALDVCNAYAIEGFLKMKKFNIHLLYDATKPIHEEQGKKLIRKWKSRGVEMITTQKLLARSF